MRVDEFIKMYPDYEYEAIELAAARVLERRTGLRFLYEFGFHNAPEMAFDLLEEAPSEYFQGLGLS